MENKCLNCFCLKMILKVKNEINDCSRLGLFDSGQNVKLSLGRVSFWQKMVLGIKVLPPTETSWFKRAGLKLSLTRKSGEKIEITTL